MNTSFRVTRDDPGLAVPFGAAGVAGLGGLLSGVAGLLIPRSFLETASYQLYLDTVIASARAPLGGTAQLVAAVLLALLGAALAYVAARALGVTAMPGGLSSLLARLRGDLSEDEEDAPPLRAADRHPDAPARRPFSASRDIPTDFTGTTIDARPIKPMAEDDDELLLDLPIAAEEELGEPVSAESATPAWQQETTLLILPETTGLPQPEVWEPAGEFSAADAVIDEIDSYDLQPPTLSDWEQDAFVPTPAREEPAAPIERMAADSIDAVDAADAPEPAEAPMPAGRGPEPSDAPRPATPPPLDLSVARLDELIARLEAGLTRKSAPAVAPEAAPLAEEADGQPEPAAPAAPPPPADDPAFPHDPALAAALATLRRMNRATA